MAQMTGTTPYSTPTRPVQERDTDAGQRAYKWKGRGSVESLREVRTIVIASVIAVMMAVPVVGQSSFTPSYNAPYRAFRTHEFGGTLSFPGGAPDWAFEGQYRFGTSRVDFGLRLGFINTDVGVADQYDFVLGVEARTRIIEHTQQFPLDGALVIGAGTLEGDTWLIPMAGLSLGRRVDIEGGPSLVLYGQPTLFVTTVDTPLGTDTDLEFGFGFGSDFRVGNAVDLRISVGVADVGDGFAVSLVWIR